MTTTDHANYQAYLASVYPGTKWTLSMLSGGMVNTTMRATRASHTEEPVDAPPSLILKHARPYVQSEGPEFTFSIRRQAVEAAMLDLVQADYGPAKYMSKEERQKHFPCLLRHDYGTESSLHLTQQSLEASILLIADLGPLENCLEFLENNATTLPINEVASIGATIGTILAGFHTTKLLNPPEILKNDMTHEVIFLVAVEPLKGQLAHLPNGAQLYNRIEEDFARPKYEYPKVLSHGDFHSGSVLIPEGSSSEAYPIVIDMEFSQLRGRGVNGDMAHFFASIHCGLIAAETSGDATVASVISCFIGSLCAAYQSGSVMEFCRRGDDIGAQLLRSAFILHGQEVINYAHDFCEDKGHAAKMTQVGVWYIERAGDDVEAFLDETNWGRMGEEHGMVIQSLFKEVHR